jgi:glycosyltransferase involved in cell wall biosynthesis
MVFVGSCEPRKGLHYALDAWLASKACKNGTFYICGKYIPEYRKLLADKLAHPSVKEAGFLSNVAPLLQKCHVLILPSIEEGSALVTYEAKACGCVLLVSEASGAKCEHNKDALVHKPGDVATLREHIDMLASDAQLFSRLRTNSLSSIGELTWDKAAESLIRAYRKCLDGT